LKPVNCSFEQAAAVPMAAFTALQGLRDNGQIKAGQKVLINGAGGGVGTFAVQLAKYFGAEVTAVCGTGNLDTARASGADHVIDYTTQDFTKSGRQYDLIFAANGYHWIFDYKRCLSDRGIYVTAGGTLSQLVQALLLGPRISSSDGRKLGALSAKLNLEDLRFMKDLVETGKVKPVIDRSYPLAATAQALRYLGKGHAKGKVIITMQ